MTTNDNGGIEHALVPALTKMAMPVVDARRLLGAISPFRDVEGNSPGPGTTIVDLPDDTAWEAPPGHPPGTFETVPILGSFLKPGFYVCYARWFPGWMSTPHSYLTDRQAIVVSGTWSVGAGTRIDLASTIPMTQGQYAIRKAGTSHYDGTLPDATEPAVFILFGYGPAIPILVDPTRPPYVQL
ncbi:hypothetical protein NONI108955_05915 [Nocardia ninae]|uniref:ChrR-like cupin domain-containing protein n=1 Tax=Nocardia ninae NBRC 108245 TaxID=1210091 RepID=A0A511MDU2_9NOCA|nr:hypothetical protein [Nocardia ninae]GEM38820.1 hypothetical protein NN4_33390 [Nocardia ninae NBRC 108245]